MVKGVFVKNSDNTNNDLNSLGADFVFVNDADFANKLGFSKKKYLDFAVFDESLLGKFPDAKAVYYLDENSEIDRAQLEKTFTGICPSHKELRAHQLEKIAQTLKSDSIDGIWLSDLQYFTKWSQEEPLIVDTCYCDRCLEEFSNMINEPIEGDTLEDKFLLIDGCYYHEWLKFKSDQLVSFVKEVKQLIDESEKELTLGVFVVPWDDTEYSSAIKRIIAQDFQAIAEFVDFLSPMFYQESCKKDATWISDRVEYFWSVGKSFIPVVEVSDDFETVLKDAVAKPSSGVAVMDYSSMVKQNKVEIFKGLTK